MSYPEAPPQPDVAKARKLINQTLDAMPDADIIKLAQQLQSAAAAVLLSRASVDRD